MKNKSLKRLGLIANNTIRQVLISLFGMAIPFLVIHFSSKEIWGEFVAVFLYSLFALQIINWGNKEYLLRKFSENPSKITMLFSENMATRLVLVVVFSILGLFLFSLEYWFWITIWLVGRYWIHSVEALIVYQKEFSKSIIIEVVSFIGFGFSFYFLKYEISVYSLLLIYSSYHFFKGLVYFFLFRKYFVFQKALFKINYFKNSFSFFILSILGFLASKIDVYIIESFGNKTITAEYQIINSLLVFVMLISAFVYSPFTKMIYRNKEEVINKIKITLALIGLVIIPIALLCIHFIIRYYLKTDFSAVFYLIAFLYIYPSYIYGLDIVNLFRQHKEKIVVKNLILGVIANTVLTSLFLYSGYGITGDLLGSAIAQLFILYLFKIKYVYNLFVTNTKKKFYAQLIHKGDLCFDIGANIGNKSQLFLSLGAKVIAFEPQTACQKQLEIIKKNNSNFEFYPFAVGAINEEKELHLATHIEVASLSNDFIAFYTNDVIQWNQKETVTVKTLETLTELFGIPSYCKIDTEGYELNILSSLQNKIPIIEFEFTEGLFEDTLKIISLLDSDNTSFNFILNEHLKFKLKNWVSANKLREIITALPKNRLHGNIFVKTNVN